ncbi:hypothetical protein C5Y96_11765 [Blastopirellula marina]|uniref:Uncharacterized protein n=1 Tax=Blastopirellula marina TaxID=124 RepID=A0A2S8FFS8_9BACT|nr:MULTISPECIES: hypothetical protein [Pirellulaceae]PQO31029.1 hypothetical protein C5Y96_11765 [Blastopirellula marina]RCS51423.1 hypothetical protein DTL36_11775 [Bremerella cremea]
MTKSGELDLSSGRRIYLKQLEQYLTYEGLLEGLPTAERNQQRLQSLVAEHQDKPYDGTPYLIPPVETPIDHGRPYPFGTPSALPSVTCIGRFTSLDPAKDKSYDYSGLVILWYQQDYAMPIDPAVVGQIRGVDWETHAADLYY